MFPQPPTPNPQPLKKADITANLVRFYCYGMSIDVGTILSKEFVASQ